MLLIKRLNELDRRAERRWPWMFRDGPRTRLRFLMFCQLMAIILVFAALPGGTLWLAAAAAGPLSASIGIVLRMIWDLPRS